jgi:hypothetical protein
MSTEQESCPACGALPCDWVTNPHQAAEARAGSLSTQLVETKAALNESLDEILAMTKERDGLSTQLGEAVKVIQDIGAYILCKQAGAVMSTSCAAPRAP